MYQFFKHVDSLIQVENKCNKRLLDDIKVIELNSSRKDKNSYVYMHELPQRHSRLATLSIDDPIFDPNHIDFVNIQESFRFYNVGDYMFKWAVFFHESELVAFVYSVRPKSWL